MRVYIGTYTILGGKGIYQGELNSKTGELTLESGATLTDNPSFLAINSATNSLYCVNEVEEGRVTAFKIAESSGKLKKLNTASSEGTHPCHISIHPSGRFCLVANYGSGSAAIIPIKSDGSLGEGHGVQHQGASVDPQRQRGPHAHFASSYSSDLAFVTDLGIDRIMIYKVSEEQGTLTPHNPPWAKIKPGAGPRHLAFHPTGEFVYLINELNSTISVFTFNTALGELTELETLTTLPPGFAGENTGADIRVHPSGNFVYASNRGHNSIAIFQVKRKKNEAGGLKLIGHEKTQGDSPRNFALSPDGKMLIAANQNSNNLTVFKIDSGSGLLTPTGQDITIPAPVCVVFG